MAFIDSEELKKRLAESENLCERLSIPASPVPPRPLDKAIFKNDGTATSHPVYSEEFKAIIGATALLSSNKQAAEIFDVSPSLVGAVARGEFSKASHPDPETDETRNQRLQQAIFAELAKIRETAREKLLVVLGLINKDTLESIADKDKARLAAQMANQLSSVIERTIQKSERFGDVHAHLHLYAPEQRPLGAFDIKQVGKMPEANPEVKENAER